MATRAKRRHSELSLIYEITARYRIGGETQCSDKSYRQEVAAIENRMDRMARFKSSILLIVLTVAVGCSAIERPVEPETNPAEQKEKQRSPSVPTFTYRPGAGLMIEGR